MKKIKIGLVNVGFSPNLGDGIIADSIRHDLNVNPFIDEVINIDLAGRNHYSNKGHAKKLVRDLLRLLPLFMRNTVSHCLLDLLILIKLRSFYKSRLKQVDMVMVGGGNLFSDNELNFPKKIHAVLQEASKLHLPVHVHSVSVSGGWSARGRAYFQQALRHCDLMSVSVRDSASRQRWLSLLPMPLSGTVELEPDPGLRIAAVYPLPISGLHAGRHLCIGLGVTSTWELNYHGLHKTWLPGELMDFYMQLIEVLIIKNCRIKIFTNGNPDDRLFASNLFFNALKRQEWSGFIEDATDKIHVPKQLCQCIFQCDGVIAFRMHAIIVALSYDIPCVALHWDDKVRYFLSDINHSNRLKKAEATECPEIAAFLLDEILKKNNISTGYAHEKQH